MNNKKINVAVIIPVHNRRELTLRCLKQLQTIDRSGFELDVIVIDDGSTDGTADAITADYTDVTVLYGDGNLWWTAAINKGMAYAVDKNYDYILTLNDDIDFQNDFLEILIETSKKYPGSLVSSISLLHNDGGVDEIIVTTGHIISGRLRHFCPAVNNKNFSELSQKIIFCDALSGRSLLIPVNVIKKIGFLNAKCFPHGHGDIEFTHRAKLAGFSLIVNTASKVYTELNRNHFPVYLINSTKWDFIRNTCNIRYAYGFKLIFSLAFMHKPFYLGVADLLYGLARLFKWILMKLFIPKPVLKKLISKKIDVALYGPFMR